LVSKLSANHRLIAAVIPGSFILELRRVGYSAVRQMVEVVGSDRSCWRRRKETHEASAGDGIVGGGSGGEV
jgi:hypothetical protein